MASLECVIGHVGDDSMTFATPMVVAWLKDGISVNTSLTNTPGSNGRLNSTLSFEFADSDTAMYQCVFTDTTQSEVFVTNPIRLDTGELKCVKDNVIIMVD